MVMTKYGQFAGNWCVAMISFDPDVTPVDQIAAAVGRTLMPVNDWLSGQWGVGAYWDGVSMSMTGTVPSDAATLTTKVSTLQQQVDDLTAMVLGVPSYGTAQSLSITTAASTGIGTGTFAAAYASAPRIVASVRAAQANTYANSVEVLAVTTTTVTVRAWQNRAVAALGGNPAAVLAGAVVNVIGFANLA